MKKSLLNVTITMFIAFFCSNAVGGSPGGLQVVIVATSAAERYQSVVKGFFQRYNPDDGKSDCENSQLNIDLANFEIASKFDSGQIFGSAKNKSAHKRLAQKLMSYRDADHKRGLDAALAFDVQGSELVFVGVSAATDEKVQVSRMALSDLLDETALSKAICHALVHLPVMEAP